MIGFLKTRTCGDVRQGRPDLHRDFGDREIRKQARVKYIIHDRGVDWFCHEEVRTGVQLEPARSFEFTRQGDLPGWHRQNDGKCFLGLFVENGRIHDAEGYRLKSALREVIEQYQPEVRLTPSQNLLLVKLLPVNQSAIDLASCRSMESPAAILSAALGAPLWLARPCHLRAGLGRIRTCHARSLNPI